MTLTLTRNAVMTREAILKGIAAYDREQRVLLRLLRKRGQFTDREFDHWFLGREWRRPRLAGHPLSGDSFLLGGWVGGGYGWGWWLDLLQHMVSADLVTVAARRGLVVYRAKEQN